MIVFKVRRKLDGKFSIGTYIQFLRKYRYKPHFTEIGKNWSRKCYAEKELNKLTDRGYDCELVTFKLIEMENG